MYIVIEGVTRNENQNQKINPHKDKTEAQIAVKKHLESIRHDLEAKIRIYESRCRFISRNEGIRTEEPRRTEYILTAPYKVCLGTHLIEPRS